MTALQGLICLVAVALMLVEVVVLESRLVFLLAGLTTAAVALALVHGVARRRGEGMESLLDGGGEERE